MTPDRVTPKWVTPHGGGEDGIHRQFESRSLPCSRLGTVRSPSPFMIDFV
jgi:hypothetical protein